MSRAAKFLVATIGGGLLLGAAGAHLVNPEMQQRGGDEPWRNMLEQNTGSSDSRMAFSAPPRDPRPYGGKPSHAPDFADTTVTWTDPYESEWLEYGGDWPEPPTLAELDTRWDPFEGEPSTYGQSGSQAGPSSAEAAAARAEEAAAAARAAAERPASGATSDTLPQEPRVARGQLPAIW